MTRSPDGTAARLLGLCLCTCLCLAACARDDAPAPSPSPGTGAAPPPIAVDTARAAPAPAEAPPAEAPDAPAGAAEEGGPDDRPQAAGYRSEWTVGIVERPGRAAGVAVLRAVRTARHAGYDRTVFEFENELPGYAIAYIDRPVRQCGSGEPVPLAGDAWLEVRMNPAQAHTDEGRPTVADRERRPGLPVLLEMKATCDFEAYVTWVLGVSRPNAFQALELSAPPRLVVDVRH